MTMHTSLAAVSGSSSRRSRTAVRAMVILVHSLAVASMCVVPPAPPGRAIAAVPAATRCGQRASDAGAGHPLPLGKVKYFAYQIQGLAQPGAVDALVSSRYDMVVVEPTRTGSDAEAAGFDTRTMVARLKRSAANDGVHRKLVIAYVDIGEAENWRWYWTWKDKWEQGPRPASLPPFILGPDPDGWTGNFPVAYWDPRWKDLIIYGPRTTAPSGGPRRDFASALDEVLIDGFDGIYLDWVEGFSHPPVIEAARRQQRDPAGEMVAFIREIRAVARTRTPGFLVIQQNGARLGTLRPEIFETVDAIGQEEVWYDGVATDRWDDPRGVDHPIDRAQTEELVKNLRAYQAACVPVFDIEYALANAADAYARSYAQGYVPYVTRRSLSALTTTPPPALPGRRAP
jgi:cysteinyl-tRNA synthetase, unknown class